LEVHIAQMTRGGVHRQNCTVCSLFVSWFGLY
ncbi:hypothetical protein T11_9829, partial [Trichinella zimbabwensis]